MSHLTTHAPHKKLPHRHHRRVAAPLRGWRHRQCSCWSWTLRFIRTRLRQCASNARGSHTRLARSTTASPQLGKLPRRIRPPSPFRSSPLTARTVPSLRGTMLTLGLSVAKACIGNSSVTVCLLFMNQSETVPHSFGHSFGFRLHLSSH